MKNLLAIAVLLIITNKSQAQPVTIQYDTCQYLSQYAGDWLYATSSDTVRICLRYKRDISVSFKHFADNLYGWHEYKHNGITIESDYNNRFMYLPFYSDSLTNNIPSIRLLNYNCTFNNSNKFQGHITDFTQANETHSVKAELTVGASGEQYMLWKQNFVEFHGAWTGAYGMTLPREFTLIKQ